MAARAVNLWGSLGLFHGITPATDGADAVGGGEMYRELAGNPPWKGLLLPGFIVLVVVAGCSSGTSATATSGNAPASALAAEMSTTIVVSPSAAPGVAASPAPIPDGDYVTGVIPKSTAEAMLSDPALANDPDVKDFLDGFGATERYRLHFASGRFTHFVEQEGKNLGIGDEGTYAYIDDHTIAFQSSHSPGTGVASFSLVGDKLTWKVLKDPNGAGDLAATRVVFEASPYIRQP
jgi:hypothetical protein